LRGFAGICGDLRGFAGICGDFFIHLKVNFKQNQLLILWNPM
jgi:hypothetical protein